MRRFWRTFLTAALLCFCLGLSDVAEARRSGSSFGGRSFGRSSRAPMGRAPMSGSQGYNSGPRFMIFPGFGWGMGGSGFGGGSMLLLVVLGMGAFYVVRSMGRRGHRGGSWFDEEGRSDAPYDTGKAYVLKIQIAMGRSGRGLQKSLARFAAEGDTGSEAGLAALLQQTALELLRHKDSIRQVAVESGEPLSLIQAEAKMNGAALKERSRFQVERIRGAEGRVHRSEAEDAASNDVLEFVMVTLIVATRQAIGAEGQTPDRDNVEALLSALGGLPASNLLGLEVVWTPADENDALTRDDLLTEYPDLRTL